MYAYSHGYFAKYYGECSEIHENLWIFAKLHVDFKKIHELSPLSSCLSSTVCLNFLR